MNSGTQKWLICFSEQLVETILALAWENSPLAIREFSTLVLGLRIIVFYFPLLIGYLAALILGIIWSSTSEISMCLEITYGSCQNLDSSSLGLGWDPQV